MAVKQEPQTIYRVRKKPSTFATIDKRFLSDPRLGFAAKGLLTYLLSKPDDWRVMMSNLMTVSGEGRDRIRTAAKQLEVAGYFRKSESRSTKTGRFSGYETFVYETPQHATSDQSTLFETVKQVNVGRKRKPRFQRKQPEAENPLAGTPDAGNPLTGKPPVLRMNGPKINRTNSVGDEVRATSAAERTRARLLKEFGDDSSSSR